MKLTIGAAPQAGSAFKAEMEKRIVELRRAQRFAVNELAFRGLRAVQAEMDRVFTPRPTPWVRDGMRAVKVGETITSSRFTRNEDRAAARASDTGTGEVAATVEWRVSNGNEATQGGGAIPAAKILRAQIEGGPRRLKRFEVALRRIGALPEGLITTWAQGQRLDQYGNITAGRIVQILSDLRAFREVGFRANRNAGTPARFFVIRGKKPGVKLPPGIYERRKRGNPKLVLAFVKPAQYTQRINPRQIIAEVVRYQAAEVWAVEAERMATRWGETFRFAAGGVIERR